MYNFIHPAPGSNITSPFGERIHPITRKKTKHQGIDYAKSGNVPILASADGTVVNMWGEKASTYGNVIFLRHVIDGKTMDTTYAHLKSFKVKVGQKVKQGDVIGYMGNTGGSTGQHLHFEIHDGIWASGQPNAVDPEKYVNVPKTTKKLYLPPIVPKWSIYPINKAPVKANAIASLNPLKFGGLTYEILGNPQKDVYTIETKQFGKVNIYAAPSTGAKII